MEEELVNEIGNEIQTFWSPIEDTEPLNIRSTKMRSTVYTYRLVKFHNDEPGYYLGTVLLLRPRGGGVGGGFGGYNFLTGLILGVNFENAQNVRGVEILRHRAGLLCNSCQTILWFFANNKMLPV